jgi:hypothetical protein
MSELTQKLKNQGWTNSCDCQHALHLHCHNQILKPEDEIRCQSCDKKMSFDAHIYEHEFGKNNAMLRSVYFCDSFPHQHLEKIRQILNMKPR